jgi:hypothetical protein
MTRAQANHLVEGERVKTRELAGTVVGATKNCVSIQWDGRATPEIFTANDMRNISKEGQAGKMNVPSSSHPVSRIRSLLTTELGRA